MVVFTKPASDSADWTVVGQSRTEENLSVNIGSYTDVEFTFSNLLLNTSQEYVFAFVSDAAMLGRLTIGTSLQAEEGADSPFSVDNGFAYASMQSTAFYSGAPVILYYNTGNETSMYFPNMIVTVTDPESVPEPASFLPFARREKPYRVIGHSAHPPTQAQGLHLAELAAPTVFRTSTSLA